MTLAMVAPDDIETIAEAELMTGYQICPAVEMVECGYKPVEALQVASECVRNREVRASVDEVRRGVQRGEKLSIELQKHEQFFFATFCQLVGVGEQSGDFPIAMRGTCEHLRERLESRIDATVVTLEPTDSIQLAGITSFDASVDCVILSA